MAHKADVIDIRHHKQEPTICRLLPELDGIEMLYTNDTSEQIFSLKVLCWALWSDGKIDGMVPWLNRLVPCRSLDDPLNGHWEGYLEPDSGQILFDIPDYKRDFLNNSAEFYPPVSQNFNDQNGPKIIQEVRDMIGSHAIFTSDHFKSFNIQEIHSWRLYEDGSVLAMSIEEETPHKTPVLPGDDCLYSVQHRKDFHYFFQHSIANKLKDKDPAAMAAMAKLAQHSN